MLNRWLARVGHGSYDELERRFREHVDPWHFQVSPYEQERFAKTLDVVQGVPHTRILEVGCAEGHFTAQLLTISDDVTAIDLSAEAIGRAQQRAAGAHFIHAKLEDLPIPPEPYDVVVCGEMLYYVEDLVRFLETLRALGRYLVTSTCYPSAWWIHRELASCKRLRTVFHMRVRELRATSIRLWEL